jgi:TonB family protein
MPLAPHTVARSGAIGTAVVHVSVDADGGVLAVDIVGNTHRELDEVIARAAQSWRFLEIPGPFGGGRRGLEIECRLVFGELPQ